MAIARQLSLSLSIPLILTVNAVFVQAVNATQIARLINQGEIEKARQSLEAQNPTTADRLFFEGQILKAQGQLRQAIAIFRQLLQQAPDYRNARRELAHSLFLAGHYDLAEQQFFNLLQNEPNQAVAQGYRRFLGFIGAGKPTGWASDFALLPSSNVNRGTTNTVFNTRLGRYEIDPQSQAESGTGVRLGLSGYIKFPTGVGQRLVLRAPFIKSSGLTAQLGKSVLLIVSGNTPWFGHWGLITGIKRVAMRQIITPLGSIWPWPVMWG